jgi:2'-5' RNA ligase
MGSNLVVVAIPDENDHVWKVSSEKIPHLTLLFLGDVDQVSNLDDIVQFVEHAANTTLRRFYLTVDRRGELGEDKADVLFFKPRSYDAKSVHNFRNTLLKDNNIRTAHDLATQHEGPWNPHLTMGYPETPAKKDDRDFGFYEVGFNKVAVWTDEFDGPEFLLKDQWEEFEEMGGATPMTVGMSALQHISEEAWSNFTKADYTLEQWHAACLIHTHEGEVTSKSECKLPVKTPDGALNRNGVHAAAAALAGARGGLKGVSEEQKKKAANALKRYYSQLDEEAPESLTQSSVEDLGAEFVLEHYGVKGMRWGVRKSDVGSAARSVGRAAKSAGGKVGRAAAAAGRFAGDVQFELDVDEGRAREAIISKAAPAYRKTDLPAIKARHGDYGKLRNRAKKPFSKEARAYRKDARETYIKRLESTANSMTNVSGDRQYTIRERGLDLPSQGGDLPRSRTYWDVSSRRVRHAAEDPVTRLEVIFDDEGWITDLKPVPLDEMAQTVELGEAFLAHFGVRGMRWGVRKSQNLTEGQVKFHTRREARAGKRADKEWKKGLKSTANAVKVHNEAADEVNAKISGFNSDKRWANTNLAKDPVKRKEYDDAFFQEIANPAYTRAAVKVFGEKSPGGRYRFEVVNPAQGTVRVVDTKKVKHAEEDVAMFKITRNAQGFITKIEPMDTVLEQTIDLGSVLVSSLMEGDALEHYGVKGMRWGVRKASAVTTQQHIDTGILRRQTKVQAKGGESQPASDDAVKAEVQKRKLRKSGTAALSNQELRDLQTRLQLEAQVELLATRKGKKFVSKQLEETGKQEFQRGLGRGVRKAAPTLARTGVAKKVKKGAATAAVTALL